MGKTKTNRELAQRTKELEKKSDELDLLKEALLKRTKELKCLYTVLEIINHPGIALEERFEQVAAIVSQGWQYSEIAAARIVFEGRTFTSKPFQGGPLRMAEDIIVDGNKAGVIEIYYREARPKHDEGPFLKEERDLINAIAERISRFIERRRAEEARQIAQKRLQEAITKILSGFLPICAKCKKIRDDANNWVEIESYIRDHTEAEFSHSICPECRKILYPKFVKKM